MGTILCNISALAYARTPPAARDLELTPTDLAACASPQELFGHRSNTAKDIAMIRDHLAGPLKGLSLPIHICNTEKHPCRHPLIVWHDLPNITSKDLIPIDDGLFVTSPCRTVFDLAAGESLGSILKLMTEMCGLYSLVPKSEYLSKAFYRIQADEPYGVNNRGLASFYDATGKMFPFTNKEDEPSPWCPCGSSMQSSSFWKRPPICSAEEFLGYGRFIDGYRGSKLFQTAAELVSPGSASPFETIISALIGPSRRRGQEGLPHFWLNRQVAIPNEMTSLAKSDALTPDIGWFSERDNKLIHCCEADGAEFHTRESTYDAKRQVYRDAARRAVYEHLGIHTTIITYPQVSDLEQWDMLLDVIYKQLKIKRPKPTVTFLKKRELLHRDLMAPGL